MDKTELFCDSFGPATFHLWIKETKEHFEEIYPDNAKDIGNVLYQITKEQVRGMILDENIRPDNIESIINALPEVKESIVLARDGKLVAIVVPQITNHKSQITNTDFRRMVLRTINPQLPLYSQLYDVEITDVPLQRTEKQTIKRYLYTFPANFP